MNSEKTRTHSVHQITYLMYFITYLLQGQVNKREKRLKRLKNKCIIIVVIIMDKKLKAVILDGYTENPGDLSWKCIEDLTDLTVYDRTPPELVIDRAREAIKRRRKNGVLCK